jgi:gliding motility-associated-like protein
LIARTYIFCLIALLASGPVLAQLTLDRQVISCFSLNISNPDTGFYSTAGQVETMTLAGENGYITQGFEQPFGVNPIQVAFEVYLNDCTNLYEVYITQITGCTDTTLAEIYWNGQLSGTFRAGLPSLSTLQVVGSDGCAYEETIDFSTTDFIPLNCDIHFYNFLSPNADGDNDEWVIDNIQYTFYSDNTISIYNRWGNVVWTTRAYNNSDKIWKGQTQSGEDLPDGTYYYEAVINGRMFNGFVELSR